MCERERESVGTSAGYNVLQDTMDTGDMLTQVGDVNTVLHMEQTPVTGSELHCGQGFHHLYTVSAQYD